MPVFLSGLAGKGIAVLVILLLLGGAYARYRVVLAERNGAVAQVGALRAAVAARDQVIAQEKQINAQNVAIVDKLRKDFEAADGARVEANAAAEQRVADLEKLKAQIIAENANAKPAERVAPVPPVITRVLDGLAAAPAAGGDANPGSAPARPPKHSFLHRRAKPAKGRAIGQ